MTDAIDVEAVEVGAELAEAAAPNTLWRTDSPEEVLTRAIGTAEALMPVVRAKGLVVKIQGREHLTVEAWQTLGAMVGVSPVCAWTKKLENGWEARVEARTLDGRVIGAAEAECLTDEARWKSADDFAVRSMAQTRATSKALASVLRFVATLGGASGTPAEEMPREGHGGRDPERPASEKQRNYVANLMDKADFTEDQLALIRKWSRGERGLRAEAASFLIEKLRDGSAEGRSDILLKVGFTDVPVDDSDLAPQEDTALPDPDQPADDDLPPL